jgi:hypothetical protein
MQDFLKKLLVNVVLGAAAGAASAYANDATREALEKRRSRLSTNPRSVLTTTPRSHRGN